MPDPVTAYIALGSNQGDRAGLLARGVREMAAAGLRVLRQSPLYETEPVEAPGQPWFLNAVIEAETTLEPDELLETLLGIERKLGRRRTVRNAPRTIDLDILFYGARVIRTGNLEVPHPRLAQRRFVLVPLAELAPALLHPILGKSVEQLLAESADRSEVRPWRPAV